VVIRQQRISAASIRSVEVGFGVTRKLGCAGIVSKGLGSLYRSG